MAKRRSRAFHKDALENATRGSIADYQEAVLAAVEDGFTDLCSANDVCWAERVIKLKKQVSRVAG